MKKNNKLECPECKSKNVLDTGSRLGEAQNMRPNGKVLEAVIPVYECRDCHEMFQFVNKIICPKCNSDQVKKAGPFAEFKPEGQSSVKGPGTIHYHCWNCDSNWQEN